MRKVWIVRTSNDSIHGIYEWLKTAIDKLPLAAGQLVYDGPDLMRFETSGGWSVVAFFIYSE